ncbi:MAG: pyridoxamine 5'-phosphate oxidase family protein [Pseudonocardia sp.]|nr:pyridoxamine 5'-phosphate oxidase family protein [Pseudonocardia sp.]
MGDVESRRLVTLSREESLRLLAGAALGRVVFTERALPAIRPVNHLIDKGMIIIRTHLGATVLGSMGTVVAYEADEIDPRTHTGWSVIATGLARRVRDLDDVARYEQVLHSWVPGEKDQVFAIEPEILTGYTLVDDE